MNCLKCGKETADPHIFCSDCQEAMESAPIKPGTPVHLPHRAEPQDKKTRYRAPTPAETILSLKGLIRWLTATVAILTIIVCLLAGILFHTISQQNSTNMIGKNYTTNTGTISVP